VRWRQAHCQLHPHDSGDVGASGLDLVGDTEQGQDKEAIILGLIPTVGNTLVGDLVIFIPIFQHIRTKGTYLALRQARDKGLAPHELDLFVAMVDCNKHFLFLLNFSYVSIAKLGKHLKIKSFRV